MSGDKTDSEFRRAMTGHAGVGNNFSDKKEPTTDKVDQIELGLKSVENSLKSFIKRLENQEVGGETQQELLIDELRGLYARFQRIAGRSSTFVGNWEKSPMRRLFISIPELGRRACDLLDYSYDTIGEE